MEESLSKINRLTKGVTSYPAVGDPCGVPVYDNETKQYKTYWLGHVFISEREGKYLRPQPTIQAANMDAINAVVAIKKG
jgi:hypothetical protein